VVDVSEWDSKTVSEVELINKIMSEVRNLLKTSGYSDRAIQYYENHVNVGNIENPDAHAIFTGPCGDTKNYIGYYN